MTSLVIFLDSIYSMLPQQIHSISIDEIKIEINNRKILQELKDAFKRNNISLSDSAKVKVVVDGGYVIVDDYFVEKKGDKLNIYVLDKTLVNYGIKILDLMQYIFMESKRIPRMMLSKQEYDYVRGSYENYLNGLASMFYKYYPLDAKICGKIGAPPFKLG